ncbi:SREC-like protein [Mya arenaria]|uniref:SREC-like protein n=1 Tax=Mya arenaria TaxID=6604 RepID=A0ABY7F7H6_MYAAR|nr:SREC-like protein [Mya arenaria]
MDKEFYYHHEIICVQIPDECQSCGCCAYRNYNKCDNNGYCYNGCQDGYWGDRCYNKCKYANCLRCARINGNTCEECKTGYYGYNCGSLCGTNCNTCDKNRGCLSCVKGYWGTSCPDECGYQCKSCNKWSGCTECNAIYYGSRCEYYCGNNCASCDKRGILRSHTFVHHVPITVHRALRLHSALPVRTVDLEIYVSINVKEIVYMVVVFQCKLFASAKEVILVINVTIVCQDTMVSAARSVH